MGFGPTEFLIVTGPVQLAVTFGRIIHTRHRRTVYWHGMVYLFTLLGFDPSTPGFICFTLPGFEHSAPGWILFHPTGIRTLNPWVYFVHPTGIWTLNHWDYYVPTFEHSTWWWRRMSSTRSLPAWRLTSTWTRWRCSSPGTSPTLFRQFGPASVGLCHSSRWD